MRRLHFIGAMLLIAGCGVKPEPSVGPPPIEFNFRKSQIPTQGLVAGLSNTSKTETLTNLIVHVRGKDEQGTRSHRLKSELKPQDTVTVGWLQLDGWKLKPGDSMTVTCDQYTAAAKVVVSEPQ